MFELPPEFLKNALMILKFEREEDWASDKVSWATVIKSLRGTGFLVGYRGKSFLVTARHVVTENDSVHTPTVPLLNLVLGFETKGGGLGGSRIDEHQMKLGVNWVFPQQRDIDLAITPLGVENHADVKWFSEKDFASWDDLQTGDDVFYLGFPLRITPDVRIIPLTRRGNIALLIEEGLTLSNHTYPKHSLLLDSMALPGNSGSPIFSKARLELHEGSICLIPPRFLGVIIEAIENANLAVGLAATHVKSLLEEAYKLIPTRFK